MQILLERILKFNQQAQLLLREVQNILLSLQLATQMQTGGIGIGPHRLSHPQAGGKQHFHKPIR